MSEMKPAREILAQMGIDFEEAKEASELMKQKKFSRDSRVCVCGHSMSRHTIVSGIVVCKPNRMDCPCKKERAVLEAEDTRLFVRKTHGSGKWHALGAGLVSSVENEKTVKWLIEMVCDKCGSETETLTPVPVTQNGFASEEATGYDALLCRGCFAEL